MTFATSPICTSFRNVILAPTQHAHQLATWKSMGLDKGARVYWTRHDDDIPVGDEGTVAGFTSDLIRVKFTKGEYNITPSELLTEEQA